MTSTEDQRVTHDKPLLQARAARLAAELQRTEISLFVSDSLEARVWLLNDLAPTTLLVAADGTVAALDDVRKLDDALSCYRIGERIGVDAKSSIDMILSLSAHAKTYPLLNATRAFRHARSVKDGVELARIIQAIRLAEHAMSALEEGLRPGRTETDLAQDFERAARVAGSDSPYYEISVASGNRTAQPWAGVTSRTLRPGDPITVDAGVWKNFYRGDLTRSYLLPGSPHGDQGALLGLRRQSEEATSRMLDKLAPGVSCGELARVAAEALGMNASPMRHLPGHGIGLEVHEAPALSPDSDVVIETGMIIALEPGAYAHDIGFREEALVVVTDDGWQSLHAHELPIHGRDSAVKRPFGTTEADHER